jgi:hypothetical protein
MTPDERFRKSAGDAVESAVRATMEHTGLVYMISQAALDEEPMTPEELDKIEALARAKTATEDCFEHAGNVCADWCKSCQIGKAATVGPALALVAEVRRLKKAVNDWARTTYVLEDGTRHCRVCGALKHDYPGAHAPGCLVDSLLRMMAGR